MKNEASKDMQAEAWHILWPVLVELGVNEKCPTGTGLKSAIEFVRGLTAERDEAISNLGDAIQSYNSLSNTGSMIFAEVNALAERALGHSIEPGHTAVYAVELLTTEVAGLRQACEGLLKWAVGKAFWEKQSVDCWDMPQLHNNAVNALKAIAFAEKTLVPATTGEGKDPS